MRRPSDPPHPDTGQSWNNLGTAWRELGDTESARAAFGKAAHILADSLGPAHPDTATTWHNLSGTLLQLGQIDAAEALCDRALAARRAVLGDEHQATADSLMLRAALLQARGQRAATLAEQEAAHAILDRTLGRLHERTAKALTGLARLHLKNGDPRLAMAPARAALFAARRAVPRNLAVPALALNNLGHGAYSANVSGLPDISSSRPRSTILPKSWSGPATLIKPEMGWLPPSPDGIAMCQDGGVREPQSGKDGNRDERYDDRN